MWIDNKKAIVGAGWLVKQGNRVRRSGGLNHAIRFQAVGANGHPFVTAVHIGAHLLKIRHPPAPCQIVRVADVVAGHRFLTADLADSCHSFTLDL
jgi:hypothetical protein